MIGKVGEKNPLNVALNVRGMIGMESEAITLLKRKFHEYDTVLKEIRLQLCDLQQKNVILRAKVEKLEKAHQTGSEHMAKYDFRKGIDLE